MNLKSDPYRVELTRIVMNNSYDKLSEIPGIKVVENRNPQHDREIRFDCAEHVFRTPGIIRWRRDHDWSEAPPGYDFAQTLMQASIVAYFLDGKNRHLGLVQDDESIISKIGYAHIITHPLERVPEIYGWKFELIRRI